MTRHEETYNELKSIMLTAKEAGYQCHIYNEPQGDWLWGVTLTPNGNILTINRGCYGGWTMTLNYVPTRANGSGCQCLPDAVDSLTLATLAQAERAGLAFALQLRSPLYADTPKAIAKMYKYDEMEHL